MRGYPSIQARFSERPFPKPEFVSWNFESTESLTLLQRSNRRVHSRAGMPIPVRWPGRPGETAKSSEQPFFPFSCSECTLPIDAHSWIWEPKASAEKSYRGRRIMPGPPLLLPCVRTVEDEGIRRYCSPSGKLNTTSWSDHSERRQGRVPVSIDRTRQAFAKASGYNKKSLF